MTKHVTLFGRKMRSSGPQEPRYTLGNATLYREHFLQGRDWWGEWVCGNGDFNVATANYKSPHAAARALERKIVAAHRRLGKLMNGTKGRSK